MKKYLILLLSFCLLLSACNKGGGKQTGPTHYPFKESKKDLWGLVDANGKVLVENEFKEEPSLVMDGMFFAEAKGGIEMYSINNPTKPIGETFKGIAYFNDGLAPCVQANEGIKYIDKNGVVKFELPLEYVYAKTFDKGYSLIARKGGDNFSWITESLIWDAISTNGQIIMFDDYSIEAVLSNERFLVSGIEGKFTDEDRYYKEYFILDTKGNVLVQLKNMEEDDYVSLLEFLSPDIKQYVFYDDVDDAYGIKDINGEIVLKAKYPRLRFLKDGTVVFYEDEDCGLMDVKGNIIMRPKYSDIRLFSNDKYIVAKDEKMALLNGAEDRLIGYEYDVLYGLNDKTLLAYDFGHKSEIITLEGKSIASFSEFNPIMNDYYYVKSDYVNVREMIQSILYPKDRSVNDLFGYINMPPGLSANKMGKSFSYNDIDEENNWLKANPENCDYGRMTYSVRFEKVVEITYDYDDYWEIRPNYSYSNYPCNGIYVELALYDQYCNREKMIEDQLESVVKSLDNSFRTVADGIDSYYFENEKVKVSFMVESNRIRYWAVPISMEDFPRPGLGFEF